MASEILIVDDEADIRELIAGILEDEGYATRTAPDSESALSAIEARIPSLVVLDIWLDESQCNGLELLSVLQERYPGLPVVMISGHGNIETAVSAIRNGAYDYIEKPFKADKLILTLRRAIEAYRLRHEIEELKIRACTDAVLVGSSGAIAGVRQIVEKIAPTGSRVLITGPAGSGKEITARLLHAQSRRNAGPFVAINAAMMEPDRLKEELFGTESIASGPRKIGAFEKAHGGTLFLDEVADMPPESQSKILRVLIDQTFTRVGGVQHVEVDVRVVSSSSRDLRKQIAGGLFREDLFHRLNVMPVAVPPLSERREDIPALIEYFMPQISRATGLPVRKISDDAIAALQAHSWPGNVRQLRNNVERLLILSSGNQDAIITVDMLPSEIRTPVQAHVSNTEGEYVMTMRLREARETFEREYLLAQISRFGGNISRTAAFVGMERSALHRKLKTLGVSGVSRVDMQPN